MTSIIIPDIHENIQAMLQILTQHPDADEYIFLGDWFDRWPKQPGNREDTMLWLNHEAHEDTAYRFILGNHDMPYRYPQIPALQCSGYRWEDQPQIMHSFADLPWCLHYECQGYLLSHAGFTPEYCEMSQNELARHCQEALEGLAQHRMHSLVAAGAARGGYGRGGCTWLDWNEEFNDYPERPQIVGHTRGHQPRKRGSSWCIDTAMHSYGVIEDGQLDIKELE